MRLLSIDSSIHTPYIIRFCHVCFDISWQVYKLSSWWWFTDKRTPTIYQIFTITIGHIYYGWEPRHSITTTQLEYMYCVLQVWFGVTTIWAASSESTLYHYLSYIRLFLTFLYWNGFAILSHSPPQGLIKYHEIVRIEISWLTKLTPPPFCCCSLCPLSAIKQHFT